MTDFTKVFLATRKRLTDVVSKIVPSSDVEDIVQDTFIRTHLAKNKQDIQKPEAFMVQVAKNLAYDYVKSARVKTSHDPGDDFTGFVDSLQQDADIDITCKIVVSEKAYARFCEEAQKLPEKCREVYLLKKVYGFTQKEIAAKLGLAESTVEKHIAFGTKRLFQLMKNDVASFKEAQNHSPSSEVCS